MTGPGRFRFIPQPLAATLLGIRGGVATARAGRALYLLDVLTNRRRRGELVRDASRRSPTWS